MTILRQLLGDFGPGYVLDVATGRGGFIETLDEDLDGHAAIVGVDINRGTLSAARQAFSQERFHFGNYSAQE